MVNLVNLPSLYYSFTSDLLRYIRILRDCKESKETFQELVFDATNSLVTV